MKTKQNSYDQLKKGKRIWLQTGLKLTHSDYVGFNPRGIFSGIGLDSQSKECFFTNLVFINAMRGLKIGILDRKLESYFKSSLLIKYWEFINNTLTNQNNLKSENLIQIPTSEEIHTNNMSKAQKEFYLREVKPKFEETVYQNIYIMYTGEFSIDDYINPNDIYSKIEDKLNGLDIVLWNNFDEIVAYNDISSFSVEIILSCIRETTRNYVNRYGFHINTGISISIDLNEYETINICNSQKSFSSIASIRDKIIDISDNYLIINIDQQGFDSSIHISKPAHIKKENEFYYVKANVKKYELHDITFEFLDENRNSDLD